MQISTEESGQSAMSAQTSSIVASVAPTAQRVALRCAGLVKRFADVTAVNGLDLEIFTGECFGLLGPNGAGKTTTVEILEGLTPSNEGTVELLGQHWTKGDERALRERIGVQLQETQLAEKVTVVETLRLFRSFYKRGHSVMKSSTRSPLKKNETRASASSRADRNRGSQSPARSSAIPSCCFWMSQLPDSIHRRVSRSGTSSKSFAPAAGRFS